jgi:hypothetical protein
MKPPRHCPLAVVLALDLLGSHWVVGASLSYRFRLHKFEQPIGTETVSVLKTDEMLQMQSTFEFTDRGTKAPLKTTLNCSFDYTPALFTISGSTSRQSTINTNIAVANNASTVRDGKLSRRVDLPRRFFTIAGYAPAALQTRLG